MTKNTTIAKKGPSLCAFFLFFHLQPTFCDDLETCTNSVLLSHCQFKFLLSHVDFGKPSFCLQAKTWFAKVNMRQKELKLTVGKRVLNLYKSPNHHKKLAEGEKLEKSTQRGTVLCNSCVPSHILFSFIFLPFTFLILLFIFSATVSACLRKDANKQKQWLKK